jgi:hypothetical protein
VIGLTRELMRRITSAPVPWPHMRDALQLKSGSHKSNAAIPDKHEIELIASLWAVEIGKPH